MKNCKSFLFCCLAAVIFIIGCSTKGKESKITGTVNYNGAPISEVSIEVYLKGEKDKSTPPFITGESGKDGTFTMIVPSGKYFIIAKKRFIEGGITRMLLGDYPKNPVEVKSGDTAKLSPFSLFNIGEDRNVEIEGTGIVGKVTKDDGNIVGSYVYAYPKDSPDMIGPSYVTSSEVNPDGTFKINLLPGEYYIGVRQRNDKTKLGYLNSGDFAVDYKGNPAMVEAGKYLDLGEHKLHLLDEKKLEQIKKDEVGISYAAKITGMVTNEDNEPVQGIYVYAYSDPKMVGKPEAISKKSDENGKYIVYLPTDKKYYIGARTNYGGPLEPGEYVGTYNAAPDHSINVSKGSTINSINITVKEVW